jgi:hypothetical protein
MQPAGLEHSPDRPTLAFSMHEARQLFGKFSSTPTPSGS